MAADYYEILGVPRDADPQDIKKAFRQIARECHPDVAGADPVKEERFKEARLAYETLMDPVARGRYDRRGQRRPPTGGSFFDAFYQRTGEAAGETRAGGSAARPGSGPAKGSSDAGGARGHRRNDPRNDIGLDDLFNDFGDFGFGNKRPSPAPAPPPPPSPEAQPGADVRIDLDVPARVARDGGSVTAVYQRQVRSDSWRPGSTDPGLVRSQDVAEVRVIPGTRDGTLLKERGLGDAGPWGGPPGDLVVRVRVVGEVAPEPEVEAASDALEVDITVVEALLGGRIELDTPQGKVRLSLPPGTSSGAKMRLKGKGRGAASAPPADLFVTFRIVVPKRLDDQSRRLIEEFASLNPWDPRSG